MAVERLIEIFGRKRCYEGQIGLCELKKDLITLEKLMEEIEKPQILSYCGMETVNFYIREDEHFMGSDMINWIYDTVKDVVHVQYIRDCLLACAEEDVEWTRWRNENLTGIFYRKIVFKQEIQTMAKEKLQGYKDSLEALRMSMEKEIEAEESRIREEKGQWEIIKVHKSVSPQGGECGRDGYFDAEYKSLAGDVVRMVSRNVFDFGCYSYPKRVEGTNEVFKAENWTEAEKALRGWLAKYGRFRGIRM